MIILSGVTAVLCAENPTGGKWVSYLPLSYRKAWPTHTVPDYLCCRPTQPAHRAPLSLDTSTKTSFQKIFPIPFSQFCSQRAQRHNTDKQLWVLSVPPPPPTLSCLSELPRVSSYQKLFRSQDTTAICKWLKKLKLNRNPIELKITVDYYCIGWEGGGRTGKKSTVTNPDITRLTPWNIFSLLCLLKSSYPKPQITLI